MHVVIRTIKKRHCLPLFCRRRLRNCPKITFNIACLFFWGRQSKISYIAYYAPDFQVVLSKKFYSFHSLPVRFSNSTRGIGRRERTATMPHCIPFSAVVWKIPCNAGTMITLHCRMMHRRTEKNSFLFPKIPICVSERPLRILKECTSWDSDSTAKHMVEFPAI